jgi:hypothetical protein
MNMHLHQKSFIIRMAWALGITTVLLIAVLLAWVWANPGVISLWGVAAFVACLLATFLLGAGLMALSFYSARAGYDAAQDTPAHERKKL